MLKIVIADDHPITRAGLRTVIEARLDARVAGEAADGLEAVQLTARERPDLLILDLSLPGLNGLDVLRQVRRRTPETNVVVLSMHSEDEYVIRALRGGAAAYVLKGGGADELIRAIESAVRGATYLSSGLPDSILDRVKSDAGASSIERYSTLTDREREVMQLIAEGNTSQEIGERLFISRRTVDKHRERIMAKLELKNQTEIVRFALRRGIIPDPNATPPPPDLPTTSGSD